MLRTPLQAFSALTLLGVLFLAKAVPAQEGGKGAQIIQGAELIVKVIGGLSAWIDDQSDDCSAAALGSAWGDNGPPPWQEPHCELGKRDCQRVGYLQAWCHFEDTIVDNGCGKGQAQALAQEGPLGSWSYMTLRADPFADKKARSGSQDVHHARAWASAKVDANVQTEEEGGAQRGFTEGMTSSASVYATVQIDSIRMRSGTGQFSAVSDSIRVDVDGTTLFQVTLGLDANGSLTASGDLTADQFTTIYDPVNGVWVAELTGYSTDLHLADLGPGEIRVFHVQAEGNGLAYDGDGPDVVTAAPVIESSPRLILSTPNPNPFSNNTTVRYFLPTRERVSLRVYDVRGSLVSEIVRPVVRGPGEYVAAWAGTTLENRSAPSGMYLLCLETPGNRVVRRVLLFR